MSATGKKPSLPTAKDREAFRHFLDTVRQEAEAKGDPTLTLMKQTIFRQAWGLPIEKGMPTFEAAAARLGLGLDEARALSIAFHARVVEVHRQRAQAEGLPMPATRRATSID